MRALGPEYTVKIWEIYAGRSSDDCIRRSSSEIIGGIVLPSQSSSDKRRGSGMSNSSASLHIHETRMTFEAMVHDQ
ncbi:hypothetical protein ANCDUO_25456, partial [Ancylostoma duodenale]